MSTQVALNLIYHEVARWLLLRKTIDEISQRTGLSPSLLYKITSRDEFKKVTEDLRTKVYEELDKDMSLRAKNLGHEIDNAAVESFDRLLILLKTSGNENIIRDVGQDFLDRAGYGKSQPSASATVVIDPITGSMILQALVKDAEGLKANKPIEELVQDGAHLNHPLNRRLGTPTGATPEGD